MKQLIKKICGTESIKSVALRSVEWLLIAAVMFACFAVFYYYDYSDTLDNAIMLGESILDGRFTEYYSYTVENAHEETVYTANYNVFLYGVFLVWNLPTFLLHRIVGFDYMNSTIAHLWCKTLVVVSLAGICLVISRILKLYVEKKNCRSLGMMLFAACTSTVIPALVVGQYDSLSLFFMLLGIYFYLKRNEKLFILFFAIAMPLKYFAIFIFIPLLLLREKNIFFVILKTVPLFLIQFICGLPFGGDEWYGIALGLQSRDAISLILNGTVYIAGFSFNPFIIIFLVIAVMCYARPKCEDIGDERENIYLPLYVTFASMASFTVFTAIRTYWIILLIPFAVTVLFFNRARLRENVLLFTVSTACYSAYVLMTHWIYSIPEFVTTLALSKVVEIPAAAELKYGSIAGFFAYHDLSRYAQLLYSVYAAGMILLLIVNFPRRSAVRAWKSAEWKFEHWHAPLQIGVCAVFTALLLYANLAANGEYVYNVAAGGSVVSETDMIGAEITQTFVAAEDDTVEQFIFRAQNTAPYRNIRDMIRFELVDAESGEVLASEAIGAGEISNDVDYRVNFSEVQLKAGCKYTIRLSGERVRDTLGTSVYVRISSGLIDTENPAYVNGEPINGNLVGSIK